MSGRTRTLHYLRALIDADGVLGCSDDDCAGRCGSCGDLVCDPIEDARSCGDCSVGNPVCGDTFCDPPEIATCPGDCP